MVAASCCSAWAKVRGGLYWCNVSEDVPDVPATDALSLAIVDFQSRSRLLWAKPMSFYLYALLAAHRAISIFALGPPIGLVICATHF